MVKTFGQLDFAHNNAGIVRGGLTHEISESDWSRILDSKHGVVGLTRVAALEYARRGIRVNAVCPGVIRTGMTAARYADPEQQARGAESEPIGRWGEPEEVAAAVVWLCSDASSFVTGVALPIDGGWLAR